MKLKYTGDISLCNQSDCERSYKCWRFQALKRLAEDQDKDVPKPIRVTVFAPIPSQCEDFILDEYEGK